jgi:hypothetical protein
MLEDIRDIRPPVNFPPNYALLVILAAVIIFTVLTLLIIYLFKRMKRKRQEPPAAPRPAHEIAYDALTELELEELPQHGRVKEFYFRPI